MKTMLFLLLCGMTFCLPFKNKPVTVEQADFAQSVGSEELVYAAKAGDSLAIEMENKEKPASAGAKSDTSASVQATTDKANTISFTTQIQPILQTSCNPCHFPSGKMYEKMPFDQPKTITDHPEGILKRFTDGAQNKLIRQFIEESK
jgi:hypothetical protein